MKFIERIKKDKGFRFKSILILVIGLIIIFSMSSEKKEWFGPDQSVCNQANLGTSMLFCDGFSSEIHNLYLGETCMNGNNFGVVGQERIDLCTSLGCIVGVGPDTFDIDSKACFGCIPAGVRTNSKNNCCSKDAYFIEYGNDGNDYLCKDAANIDPEKVCNTAEQSIASIAQSMGLFQNDCKTAYIMTLFIGGLLVFVTIGVAL